MQGQNLEATTEVETLIEVPRLRRDVNIQPGEPDTSALFPALPKPNRNEAISKRLESFPE